MAEWKKVLVSGSDIHISSITASNVPPGTGTDRVLVRSTDGGFKSVTQGSIQGTTQATFTITGSTVSSTSSFDATGDSLLFTGSAGTSVIVSQDSSTTTVTVNLPQGTISGSQQITLTDTIGFTAFSSSLATNISGNLANITNALVSIGDLTSSINGLVASSSQLIASSASIAADLNTQSGNITSLQNSISALTTFSSSVLSESQTGSFVVSASVAGTTNEIEVIGAANSGIQIGLPNNVTIPGILEAEAIIIQGQNQQETGAAIISGSTVFGTSGGNNTHRFTGSLQITGSLNIDNSGTAEITISELSTDNTVGIGDIIARSTSDGTLHTAGDAIGTAISGAFVALSASIASTIATLDTTSTTNNSNNITALQATSQSLVTSASLGIHFEANTSGSSIALGQTASFTAFGDGLTVDFNDTSAGGININYNINASTLGNAIGAFSSSTQLQNILDPIYVELSDAPISGAAQLQALGFITASDFNQLLNVPSGLLSSSEDGTGDQGTIIINGNTVAISGLGTGASPKFQNLTVSNNLTVNGDTTAFHVNNLNIEDQFILLNSGAGTDNNDKDGGIIVDNGGGSGSLFLYDFGLKAWGFRGATDENKVPFDATSGGGGNLQADVFVATVSSSNNGVGGNPTAAPAYGVDGSTSKGQMHINTADSSIWIYA